MRGVMFPSILLAGLTAAGCNADASSQNNMANVMEPAAQQAAPAPNSADACAPGEKPGELTGLCSSQLKPLMSGADAQGSAVEGCSWNIRETAFATDVLLYRTLRCDGKETTLTMNVGNHMSELQYVDERGEPMVDGNGQPLLLAKIFAGHPDGRARALWETRDSMDDKAAAQLCDLRRPYHPEGLPADALIVDVQRKPGELDGDEPQSFCGPFGYQPMVEAIDFWRSHQGYAWFFTLGTDLWLIDPASLTIVEKDASGKWVAAGS